MTGATIAAAIGPVVPIRISPAVGSDRKSMSWTPCRNSSNTAPLRLIKAKPCGVGSTPCGVRSSKRTPKVSSRLGDCL